MAERTPTNRFRRAAGLLALGLIALAALAWWTARSAPPYYFRDPARVWSTWSYQRVMNPRLSRRPNLRGVLSSIKVKTNAPDILIEMTNAPGLSDYVNNGQFEYHYLPLGQAYDGAGGRIWLDQVAVAYADGSATNLGSAPVRLPARFFDRRLQPLPADPADKKARPSRGQKLSFRGNFPAVRFVLQGDLREEVKFLAFHVFDARTHASLSSGYSWGGQMPKTPERITLDLKLWHAAPIDFVADVAFGPAQVAEFPAQVGARWAFAGGELMLVVMAEDMDQRSSTSGSSKITVRVSPKTYDRERKTTCLVFACLPRAYAAPFDIELLDSKGKPLPSRGGGTSGAFLEKNIAGTPSQIRTVRVKYYPNRQRLVFRLPMVPGLPKANRHITNLFDVRLPQVRVRAGYEFRNLVSSLAQMDVKGGWSPAQGRFDYDNLTVKELLQKYAKLRGPQYGAVIDQKNLTIEIVDQSLKARLQRLWKAVLQHFR